MTQGSPILLMIRFCIPVLVGGIFQQIYNITDALVVGNALGSGALAAIGATTSSTFFMLSFAAGLTGSFSILLSQHYGAQDEQMFKMTLANAIYVTLGSALILSLAGIFGARPLMRLLEAPDDILGDAALYLEICIGGSLAQLVYNAAAAALRSVGNSRTPLVFLVLSCVLNVALDLLFVLVFHQGVGGVAIATVTAQAIAAAACVLYMLRTMPLFRLKRSELRPRRNIIASILRIGLPMSLQSMLLGVGDMVVQGVVNSFGTAIVAAYSAGIRVMNLCILAFSSVAHSFSVYSGQNKGAREVRRIHQGVKQVGLFVIGLSLASGAMMLLFGEAFIRMFLPATDPQLEVIVSAAVNMLRVSAGFFPFLGLIWLYYGALQGVGEVTVPFISGMIELVSKVGLSILLGRLFGPTGVWFAIPIGWVLALAPSMVYFHGG
ncbi:MATE family efflux transporter, partial [Eubacteriales bacterium OttesenSCG-928-N13]|nr:MATE family efflux transporter [Eubacteriales bacterium OttesenSCG-928-N13]